MIAMIDLALDRDWSERAAVRQDNVTGGAWLSFDKLSTGDSAIPTATANKPPLFYVVLFLLAAEDAIRQMAPEHADRWKDLSPKY